MTNMDRTQDGVTTQGHLENNLSIMALMGIALSTGESWIAVGNSLTLAIYNGGAPGVLYGFVADSICYWIVAISIAELASAMPSTGTVYKWAQITGGSYGQVCSWYAGWWNFAAWIVGAASLVSFLALQSLALYTTSHRDFIAQDWHIFCSYLACSVFVAVTVLFGGKWLVRLQSLAAPLTVLGWLVSIIVCLATARVQDQSYASNEAVWTRWQNRTGWTSDGFVFCLGMLNAALAVCAPDIAAHMAEEVPRPSRTIPLAILAQYIASFITGFLYLVTLFYCVPDIATVTTSASIFPLAQLYLRATNTPTALGLLVVAMLPTFIGATGALGVAGRQGWALAAERAIPFSTYFGRLNSSKSPFNALLLAGIACTLLGCLYLAAEEAFNTIVGSFVIFMSLSYLAPLVPYLISGRTTVTRGYFWVPGTLGLIVCALACGYLTTFSVIFCFPQRVQGAENVNYASVVVVGWTLIATVYKLCREYIFK